MEHSEDVVFLSENEREIGEEIKVGMKIYSEEEAYNLYTAYALKKDFGIRKGNRRQSVSGDLRAREFLCHRAGVSDNSDEVRKGKRVDYRTGCIAKIWFTIEDGVWTVSLFDDNHNHYFVDGVDRQFLRSGQKITDAYATMLGNMVQARIRPTKSYSFLSKEVGGSEYVGFTKVDAQNYLQRKKAEMISGGDGQSLINHFKEQQAKDPNFFYSIQVDQCNRLTNFFWRDGSSKLDYDCFGDVVVFDTTFRTNKYNLICAPFVGVNHHWKNVLFGCAFLLDETTESFVWLFETFLQAMGNKKPIFIFTDEDKAMANAIGIVLPESHHRLCTWHISKKATQHLSGYYANLEFKRQFNKCFHGCHDEDEFEAEWNDMIKKFDLENHSWLKKLYSLRMKWCHALNLDTFSAGIKSTQRSESTNNVFHGFSTKTMELVNFVHHYEAKAKEMRTEELKDDFRCKLGTVSPVVKSEMLKHAINVYSIKMYSFFENEFISCLGVRMRQVDNGSEINIYEAIEDGHKTTYIVQFFPPTHVICCSCKLFEYMGMLCRHALKVLDMRNFTCIPDHYILKRWTKKAKKGIAISCLGESSSQSGKSSQSLRLSELMHEGNNVFSIGSMTERGTKVVKQKLAEALELIENDVEIMNMIESHNKKGVQVVYENEQNEELPILNPPHVRAKGVTNARIKSSLEKRKKKASKHTSTSHAPHASHVDHVTSSFYPPLQQIGIPQTTNFYNQVPYQDFPFGFTSMVQSNIHMPYTSQVSLTQISNHLSENTDQEMREKY